MEFVLIFLGCIALSFLAFVVVAECGIKSAIGFTFHNRYTQTCIIQELKGADHLIHRNLMNLEGRSPIQGWYLSGSIRGVLSKYYVRCRNGQEIRVRRFSQLERLIDQKFAELQKQEMTTIESIINDLIKSA